MAQAQLPVGYPLTTAITYFNLCKNLMETDAAITWCQRLKLLPSSKWCSCGRGMHLVNRKGCSDGVTWRCPRKGCRKELSLRGGTFFEGYLFYCTICLLCSSFLGSHLSLSIILRIIHLWSTKTPVGKTMTEVEVHLWSTCMNYIDTF